MVSGRSKHSRPDTHKRAQCSHASVGLPQARPNYFKVLTTGNFKVLTTGNFKVLTTRLTTLQMGALVQVTLTLRCLPP